MSTNESEMTVEAERLINEAQFCDCPMCRNKVVTFLKAAKAEGFREGVEASAKVAEEQAQSEGRGDPYTSEGCAEKRLGEDIAAAIRSLTINEGEGC